MVRRKVTLRLDSDVVQRAKDSGMNMSHFLEVKLVEHLTRKQDLVDKCGYRDLNPSKWLGKPLS
jgi:post-segregation antitoxin (ccd killing protein)